MQSIVTTLALEAFYVLGMAWRLNGEHLAIAGDRGAKVWSNENWDEYLYIYPYNAARIAIAMKMKYILLNDR